MKLSKLDVEVLDEVLKDIAALTHEFCRLLVCEHLIDELVGAFEVGEQKDEDFLGIPGDLHKVD